MAVAEVPISTLLANRAERDPDRVFASLDTTPVTYEQATLRANRVANGLRSLGLEKGDAAAYMLPNSVEALDCWFGMARAGLVQVPVNVEQRGALLTHIMNTARCKAVVCAAELVDRVLEIAHLCEDLRHVVVVGDPGSVPSGPAPVLLGRYAELLETSEPSDPGVAVDMKDVECVLFTSGTTGASKGVLRTHQAAFCYAYDVIEPLRYGRDDHLYCAFPLFHVFARYGGVYPMMMVDARTFLPSRFSVRRFWDECREQGITSFNFLGATLILLYNQPARPDDADNPVVKGTGSPVPVAIHREFERRFGVRLQQGYGMTEIGLVIQTPPEESRVGSCGRRVERFEVEIHDDDDHRVPPGTSGEIVVRPRTPRAIFSEYVGRPEDTLHACRNLWFHTGDMGYEDEDGWFYYVDRRKDCIRRRGENISSWEVEQVVNADGAVAESAVIGVPSSLSEEEVLAVVVLQDGISLDPQELYEHCRQRLPDFALPRLVRVVQSLPKTPTMRTEKYRLREVGVTADTWCVDPMMLAGRSATAGAPPADVAPADAPPADVRG